MELNGFSPPELKASGSMYTCLALTRILETVVTFQFSVGKVYSVNTCMIKHSVHYNDCTVQHILPG